MSTLADEFLADIANDEEKKEEEPNPTEDQIDPDTLLKPSRITEVVHLHNSEKLNSILKKIDTFTGKTKTDVTGYIEDVDPEYDLIVSSNEMSASLQNEISVIHKFIRDIYSKKFPELEQLVLHPLDYARVVRRIGNNSSSTTVQSLSDILPQSNIMTISMAVSSSTGEDLDLHELEAVNEACHTALSLDEARQKILTYVEGRMQMFAPNLTAIVGSEIATKMIGAAGGLHKLACMPSSNLFVLGKKRTTLEGFSSATTLKHHGYVSECDIIKNTPRSLEVKACRLVANRCSLAARLDLAREGYTHGEMGHKFKEDIEKKIDKWQEPPPKKKEKVLPAPDDVPRKRRGGAKMRKYKERYAMTEMRKRAFRLPFGKITDEQGNTMKSLGMLGLEGSGVVRANTREEKGFQPRAKRRKAQKGNQSTPGFATSIYAMTPLQGLELPAPEEKSQDITDGYFSTTGGFLHVGQKRKSK